MSTMKTLLVSAILAFTATAVPIKDNTPPSSCPVVNDLVEPRKCNPETYTLNGYVSHIKNFNFRPNAAYWTVTNGNSSLLQTGFPRVFQDYGNFRVTPVRTASTAGAPSTVTATLSQANLCIYPGRWKFRGYAGAPYPNTKRPSVTVRATLGGQEIISRRPLCGPNNDQCTRTGNDWDAEAGRYVGFAEHRNDVFEVCRGGRKDFALEFTFDIVDGFEAWDAVSAVGTLLEPIDPAPAGWDASAEDGAS